MQAVLYAYNGVDTQTSNKAYVLEEEFVRLARVLIGYVCSARNSCDTMLGSELGTILGVLYSKYTLVLIFG